MEVKAETETPAWVPPAVEDFRSDRLILEELSSEIARLHKRLDALEPYLPLLHRWFAMRLAVGRTLGGFRNGR